MPVNPFELTSLNSLPHLSCLHGSIEDGQASELSDMMRFVKPGK